mgnify:CR=1 FL=1
METGGATPTFGRSTIPAFDAISARSLLEWYALSGVDAAIDGTAALAPAAPDSSDSGVADGAPARGEEAAPGRHGVDPFLGPQPALLVPEQRRVGDARAIAAACNSLDELRHALARFEGCALRSTAKQLCFADGNPQAELMLIGEAPGAEEDRQGRPFVGPSGRLLDRILAEIGIDRSLAWITNVIYWRPPGNRSPTAGEIAVCLPFLQRQIALLAPRFILFIGGIAAKALLGTTDGVTKLRGRPFVLPTSTGHEIPCLVTFHPAYLLRQPLNKRFVWRDMLQLRQRLDELRVACH